MQVRTKKCRHTFVHESNINGVRIYFFVHFEKKLTHYTCSLQTKTKTKTQKKSTCKNKKKSDTNERFDYVSRTVYGTNNGYNNHCIVLILQKNMPINTGTEVVQITENSVENKENTSQDFPDAEEFLKELQKQGYNTNWLENHLEEVNECLAVIGIENAKKETEESFASITAAIESGTTNTGTKTIETTINSYTEVSKLITPESKLYTTLSTHVTAPETVETLVNTTERLWWTYIDTMLPTYLDAEVKKSLRIAITTGFLKKVSEGGTAETSVLDGILNKWFSVFENTSESLSGMVGNAFASFGKSPEMRVYTEKINILASKLKVTQDANKKDIETPLSTYLKEKGNGKECTILTDSGACLQFIESIDAHSDILAKLQEKNPISPAPIAETLKALTFNETSAKKLKEFSTMGNTLFADETKTAAKKEAAKSMYANIGNMFEKIAKPLQSMGLMDTWWSVKTFLEAIGLDGVANMLLWFLGYSDGLDGLHTEYLSDKLTVLGENNTEFIAYAQKYLTEYTDAYIPKDITYDADESILQKTKVATTTLTEETDKQKFAVHYDLVDDMLTQSFAENTDIVPNAAILQEVADATNRNLPTGCIITNADGTKSIDVTVWKSFDFEAFTPYFIAYATNKLITDTGTLKDLTAATLPLAIATMLVGGDAGTKIAVDALGAKAITATCVTTATVTAGATIATTDTKSTSEKEEEKKEDVDDTKDESTDENTDTNTTIGDYEYSPVASDKYTPEFANKVIEIGTKLQIDPEYLMTVIKFETGGTFSSKIENAAGSWATWLIQFMPETAKWLGTTVEKLKKLTTIEQLEYVQKYLEIYNKPVWRLNSLGKLYMAIFMPSKIDTIGIDDSSVVFKKWEMWYTQNKWFDTNKDGRMAVEEITGMLQGKYKEGTYFTKTKKN